MLLTDNFHLDEFIKSNTATRLGIDNTPSPEVIENLRLLCEHVLQPLRNALSCTITVSSGYRCTQLNKAVRGALNSQHLLGQAADIEVAGLDNKVLAEKIKELELPFHQLILEFYVPGVPSSGWCHVSYVHTDKPKREYLVIK